jgi:hypothetical protein
MRSGVTAGAGGGTATRGSSPAKGPGASTAGTLKLLDNVPNFPEGLEALAVGRAGATGRALRRVAFGFGARLNDGALE